LVNRFTEQTATSEKTALAFLKRSHLDYDKAIGLFTIEQKRQQSQKKPRPVPATPTTTTTTVEVKETSPMLATRYYSYNSRNASIEVLRPAPKVNPVQEEKLESSVNNLFDL